MSAAPSDPVIRRHRSSLDRLRGALTRRELRLGFLGGSITDPRPRHNWPEPVAAWFAETYPDVRIQVHNMAIGATGSELAVFQAEPHLLASECDLVFVEYSVNDHPEPSRARSRTREGLLRKLLRGGERDVVIVHTFRQEFYADLRRGLIPASIADMEDLAEHYGLSSVDMGAYALDEIRRGRMRWEEWLPDGLHPTARGSLSYAWSVIELLTEVLAEPAGEGAPRALPAPKDSGHWGEASAIDLCEVETSGPWIIRRFTQGPWFERVLETAAIGAEAAFSFYGTGLTLGFDFGRTSSEIRYRLDGGAWQRSDRDRPIWCPDEGWYRMLTIADDLPRGEHRFEMVVSRGEAPECTGSNCRVILAGVVP